MFITVYDLPTTVTIPAEQSSVEVPLTVIDDPTAEGIETVEVMPAGSSRYLVRQTEPARLLLDDNVSVAGMNVWLGPVVTSIAGYSVGYQVEVWGEHVDRVLVGQGIAHVITKTDEWGNTQPDNILDATPAVPPSWVQPDLFGEALWNYTARPDVYDLESHDIQPGPGHWYLLAESAVAHSVFAMDANGIILGTHAWGYTWWNWRFMRNGRAEDVGWPEWAIPGMSELENVYGAQFA